MAKLGSKKASELPVVIKADVQGSAEAIVNALNTPVCDREALRRRSRDFSEERIGAQYWGLIENLLQTR